MIRKEQQTNFGERMIVVDQPVLYFVGLLMTGMTFFSGYLYAKVSTQPVVTGTQPVVAAQPQAQEQPQQPQQNLTVLPPVTDKDHIRGDKNAAVVLVEYSDFECPFCQRFHETMKQTTKDYGDKVAWVLRNYPLPFHPKAQKSAEAAECAGELGGNTAYWKMADAIFDKMPTMTLEELPAMAQKIGLNQSKFKSCLDSGKFAEKIKADLDGGSKTGVSGTPGTIIVAKDGRKDFIGGAYPVEQVKQQIDKLL